mmetsp:Transcript_7876/g.11744  ORF Transcript_7876/g.11744 Transcript_7876/m.11744 type:complete len:85 (-) Transcript_7876:2383-2637(-)
MILESSFSINLTATILDPSMVEIQPTLQQQTQSGRFYLRLLRLSLPYVLASSYILRFDLSVNTEYASVTLLNISAAPSSLFLSG